MGCRIMTIRAIFIPIIRTLTYCLPSRLLRVTLLSVINLFVCNYQFATLANTARNILFFWDARRSKRQPFVKSFSLIGRCPPQMIRKIVKSFVSLSLSRHLDYRTIYLSFPFEHLKFRARFSRNSNRNDRSIDRVINTSPDVRGVIASRGLQMRI